MMKKCFWLWLLMLPLLPLQADDFERAQRVLVQVRQGQGDSLVAQFHPAIREALPAEAVSQLWKQLEQERGALLRQGPWRAERRDTLLLEQCHLYFEKDSLTFSLLTDSCRYIVGFHFTPLLVPVEYAPEKVQAEVRARIDQAWNYLKLDMDLGKTPEEAVARLPEGTDIRRVIEAMGGPSRLIATGERTFGDGTVKTYEYYNYDGFKSAYETIIRQTSALNSGPRKAVGPGMKQIGGKT